MEITLSDDLAKQLEQRISASEEFSTVEEYVNYVLGEVLKQTEESSSEPSSQAYTKNEENEVKKRLEDLGYMD